MSRIEAFIEQHKTGEIEWHSLKLFTALESRRGSYKSINYNIELDDPENKLLEGLFVGIASASNALPLQRETRILFSRVTGDQFNQWYRSQLKAERKLGLNPESEHCGSVFLYKWHLTWVDWVELPRLVELPEYAELLRPLYYATYVVLSSVYTSPQNIPSGRVRVILASRL